MLTASRLRRYAPSILSINGLPLQPVADQLLPPVGSSYVPAPVAAVIETFGSKYVSVLLLLAVSSSHIFVVLSLLCF